jgi:hypothetical protein
MIGFYDKERTIEKGAAFTKTAPLSLKGSVLVRLVEEIEEQEGDREQGSRASQEMRLNGWRKKS